MATHASCEHPPLHDNIIFKYHNRDVIQKEVFHSRNTLFVLIEKTLLIVDCANYIKDCTHCEKHFEMYIYGTWPDVRASFDGVTDLPIRSTVNGIEALPYITICNAPRFGNNFIYGNIAKYRTTMYFVMYGIEVNVEAPKYLVHKRIYIGGRPAICCITTCSKFIIIKSDGSILKAEVAYSETCNLFKIGNGYLSGEYIDNYKMVWTYTSAPALNTKPAVAAHFTDE
jgi:hypothetical protein